MSRYMNKLCLRKFQGPLKIYSMLVFLTCVMNFKNASFKLLDFIYLVHSDNIYIYLYFIYLIFTANRLSFEETELIRFKRVLYYQKQSLAGAFMYSMFSILFGIVIQILFYVSIKIARSEINLISNSIPYVNTVDIFLIILFLISGSSFLLFFLMNVRQRMEYRGFLFYSVFLIVLNLSRVTMVNPFRGIPLLEMIWFIFPVYHYCLNLVLIDLDSGKYGVIILILQSCAVTYTFIKSRKAGVKIWGK